PRVKDRCASALHDTRNSTLPSAPPAPWFLCSCSLATRPFAGSSKQKVHSTAILPLHIFPKLRLPQNRLLTMVVPLVHSVNPTAVRCIYSISLLASGKWHTRLSNPCRTPAPQSRLFACVCSGGVACPVSSAVA